MHARTAGAEQDARLEDSHSAGHARCAAPDRPVVQPPPSVRSDLCGVALSLLHFLVVQAPPRSRLQKDRANRRLMRCHQCAHATVLPCTVSRRAPFKGIPSLALRCARRGLLRAELSSLAHRPAQRRSRLPRSHARTDGSRRWILLTATGPATCHVRQSTPGLASTRTLWQTQTAAHAHSGPRTHSDTLTPQCLSHICYSYSYIVMYLYNLYIYYIYI